MLKKFIRDLVIHFQSSNLKKTFVLRLYKKVVENIKNIIASPEEMHYIVGDLGYGTWTTAIFNCAVGYTYGSHVKHNSTYDDYWLRHFMYEEDQGSTQCVAITWDNISRSLTYQFRPCSNRLPGVCKDKSDSSYGSYASTQIPVEFNDSQFPTHTTQLAFGRPLLSSSNISDERRHEERTRRKLDLCIEITAGGAAFFATITIILLIVIYIQRRKLMKAAFTSLTARRDQNNYNEIPHQMLDSITGQYHEVLPLSEISASGCQSTVQQNIDQIQHTDTSGYLIPSSMLRGSGDHYQSIAD
ncbi:unnamed protein product [Mytilus coruscus]|uniref:Uncharacterized protein n=1 Tax=Mytilus coruscus TaxID=42192 RepID=A0A6J8EE99_MYTCO|nr:unnamed protein product [Mytilus coruscus]